MPLSPHFILPTPCTFMTPHFPRSPQPLPGIRELFPDLFRPRPMSIPTPLSMIYDPQQPTADDVTNPQFPIPRHLTFPSNPPTAQDTANTSTDHSHPSYTRAWTPLHTHVYPHPNLPPTDQWPNHNPAPSTSPISASQEFSPPPQPHNQIVHSVCPSSLPDNEQSSSPLTPSPLVPSSSTELPPRSTSSEQNSPESHAGKKRHKCNICGSRWGRPSSLKIHMVSHTGVKEFVCSICKQDFGVKSNYTRHIRVHHKDSSEGIQTRTPGRRRRGSRRTRGVGPVRFVDEGPKFQPQ